MGKQGLRAEKANATTVGFVVSEEGRREAIRSDGDSHKKYIGPLKVARGTQRRDRPRFYKAEGWNLI